MKSRVCPRKWQVEAVRDGRVTGKDLERALRHQATCPECAEEERQLARLGEQVARLPELARDPLTTRRSRQRLISALNESVIGPVPRRFGGRAAFGLGLGVAAAVLIGFAFRRPSASPSPSPHADGASVIEVHAAPGARWSEHVARDLDRIDLVDGTASFKVHPHAGRRVVVDLPDGELEDLGTVFEILVAEQHTQRISVSEGRVSVRLLGRPSFSLGARETWNSAAPPPSANPAPEAAQVSITPANPDAVRSAGATPIASASSKNAALAARTRAPSSSEPPAASPAPPASAEPAIPDAAAAKAEDDAYLQIVDLLKQAKYAQARSEAKQYLLRFPNGFRRIEVLNIATHAILDDGADAGH